MLSLNVHVWSLLKKNDMQFRSWPICYDHGKTKADPTGNGISVVENDWFWTAAEQTQLEISYPKMGKFISMPVSKSSAKC